MIYLPLGLLLKVTQCFLYLIVDIDYISKQTIYDFKMIKSTQNTEIEHKKTQIVSYLSFSIQS